MKLKLQGLTSLLLASTFIVAAISGTALYLKPKGRVANWTDWRLIGLNKSQWEAIHTNACLLLLLVTVLHILFNWRIFWRYVIQRTRGLKWNWELAIAVSVTMILVAGTLVQIPPFTGPISLGNQIKRYWEEQSAAGPAPHAEEFSIERFARSIDLPIDEVVAVLKLEGLQFEGTNTTIAELASSNDLSPAQVYTLITKHYPQAIREATSGNRQKSKP